MRKVQILLIAALLVLNLVCFAWADATITLTGTLDPLTISVIVNPATLDMSIPTGQTQAVQTVTVVNKTEAPLKVKVAGVTFDAAGWVPYTDWSQANLVNFPVMSVAQAQNWAAMGFKCNTGGSGWRDNAPVPYYMLNAGGATTTSYTPGNNILGLLNDGSSGGNLLETLLGVIKEGSDTNPQQGDFQVILKSDKKRVTSKTIQGTLNLTFELTT